MGRRAATAVLTVAWLSLAGCGGPDATESEVTVVDSAGVRIVEHPLGPAPATWTPHEDQVVQLADDPATPLFEIGAALRTADGYVVADGGNYRLVFYDPDGAVRFALGREGEGPGEYRHLTLLARGVADSLLVWDRSVRRGTILSPAGDFERAFTLQTRDSVRVANVSSVYEDGSLLATGFVSLGGGPPEQGRQIYATDWYHYDAAGGFIATVRTLPATETYFDVRDSGGFLVAPVLFANRSYHLAAGMRSLAAQSYQYEVRFLTPSGTLTTIVRRTPRARPLTEDARAAETERLLSEGRSDNEQLRIVLETMEVPAQLPELAGLFVDRLQRVWVEEFDDPAERPALATWRVYGPDGLLLGAISLPRDFRLTDAGDGFVLGVATDGLGQQSVLELGFGS